MAGRFVRKLKQFTIVFVMSWIVVLFFANEKELVDSFEQLVVKEGELTTKRMQEAQEFFERHKPCTECQTNEGQFNVRKP